MQRYKKFLIYANFEEGFCQKRSKMIQKKTQDTISGNEQRWAGGSHADNGDNDVAKMHKKNPPTLEKRGAPTFQ